MIGFVAYLNGVRIAERSAPERLTWNAAATESSGDRKAVRWEAFDVSEFRQHLQPGANLLAIHGLNHSITSTDALWVAELSVIDFASMKPSPAAQHYSKPLLLEDIKTFQIRAAVLSGSHWGVTSKNR
ncbi:MAG: hypothetical protein ACI9R3_002775 [Verrucomicrobiales bacterium]|jgi:hypothetical protein